MSSAAMSLQERTVGVLERQDSKMQPGYTLFCAGLETYLIDEDGRVVHEWRSLRTVFCAYLLPNGHLLRDGSDNLEAPCFQAGGAAGFVEEVTWDNEVVWSYSTLPYSAYLTHHDLEPMPNGNVLVLCWERKSKEQAIAAGRRPDLVPDGEVWNNLVLEIAPDGDGGAQVVWQWSISEHLVQDFDPARQNYGDVAAHPELFDINYCPPGGKFALRNRMLLEPKPSPNPSGLAIITDVGKTGEKDWLHVNAVSYDPDRDQIMLSLNCACEVIVIDHGLSAEDARGHSGGRCGRGGDILYRFGNPQVSRQGSRMEQALFCQHSVHFLRGVPGAGNVLLFNNGRAPDRLWSSVDEFELPDAGSGDFTPSMSLRQRKKRTPVWSFGPAASRRGSFYCTHISACQRLPNGNTLVTMGPQGIAFEVTPDGEEVWRYASPVAVQDGVVACVRQGDQRVKGRFSLFQVHRYSRDYPAFNGQEGRPVAPLAAGRHLEA